MQEYQNNLLEYLEDDENPDYNFETLTNICDENNYYYNKFKLKSFLHLLIKIIDNHYRNPNFFIKIFRILNYYKTQISEFFSNFEIFDIFKSNKRILLYLIEENLMKIDDYILHKMTERQFLNAKYPQYFAPEIKQLLKNEFLKKYQFYNWTRKDWFDEISKDIPEGFYEKRKNGENDNYLCYLIRGDMIKDFIVYFNKTNYKLSSYIESSIFETNSFLLMNKKITLIEYAVFFGSIQIINFLQNNSIELNQSIWIYAVHGKNAEFIHQLEYNYADFKDKSNRQCLIESIKCHHNEFANYFKNNCLSINEDILNDILTQSLKYYNFEFIENDLINKSCLYELCKYDHIFLVDFFFGKEKIDINKIMVFNQ
ncbi:hypothetical protein M9Y10_039397 [Tritrichomonas musculus]|uniref:DUF3447 domain-containing protein n=1 Tax=Tritrichomonas musculus TaxID=1915356 RepID=A0ABR2KB30_9EUKA